MSIRLRFWLRAIDVAHWLDSHAQRLNPGRLTSHFLFWTIERASDAEDWGPASEHVPGAFDDGAAP